MGTHFGSGERTIAVRNRAVVDVMECLVESVGGAGRQAGVICAARLIA